MAEIINCPMLDNKIEVAYCIELQMIANKDIKPTEDQKYITEKMWEVCRKCPKQDCPTADEN